jgi:hypothetical protein
MVLRNPWASKECELFAMAMKVSLGNEMDEKDHPLSSLFMGVVWWWGVLLQKEHTLPRSKIRP